MDARHRRRPSSDRFLTTFSNSPPSTAATSDAGDEFSEDDVFFTAADLSNPSSTSSTPPPPPLFHHHNHHHNNKSFKPETFGILAALPESGADDRSNRSVFNHKPLISPSPSPSHSPSSSSSSSRMIPVVPRPVAIGERKILSMPARYHQSVPMNVPMRERQRRKGSVFGDDDGGGDDDDDDDGAMLPPHEIVARQMAMSPLLSSSVLEGAGRTLKGRDLRKVRNAVFQQTEIPIVCFPGKQRSSNNAIKLFKGRLEELSKAEL